jgi:hypothetical protein
MAVLAFGYLAPRYGLIASRYGLLSGSDPLSNASGVNVAQRQGDEAIVADIDRVIAACMWLMTAVVIGTQRRALGKVSIGAALAFTPFLILGGQNYGGEAIYRVFLFSAPWCALLLAEALVKMRAITWRRAAVIGACSLALAGGLQSLYGPVNSDTYQPGELAASLWVYNHYAPHSVLVLPDENFPLRETANYNAYLISYLGQVTVGADHKPLDVGSAVAVESWLNHLKDSYAYVVFSRSLAAYASYFGTPQGYARLATAVQHRYGWNVVYRNADATVYQFQIASPGS